VGYLGVDCCAGYVDCYYEVRGWERGKEDVDIVSIESRLEHMSTNLYIKVRHNVVVYIIYTYMDLQNLNCMMTTMSIPHVVP